MSETAMDPHTLLEALVDLAGHTQLEVRMLSAASAAVDYSPTGSTAGRVGDRVWVVLDLARGSRWRPNARSI